jgi:hypothetical protein
MTLTKNKKPLKASAIKGFSVLRNQLNYLTSS